MLDATGKVANRVKDFPLRLAQIFLRCVALGDIELVVDKLSRREVPGPVEGSVSLEMAYGQFFSKRANPKVVYSH
jgi:hypothetical protein